METQTPFSPLKVNSNIIVSFVHAYYDDVQTEDNEPMPALWRHAEGKDELASFPFPRTPREFQSLQLELAGDRPAVDTIPLGTLPRFGLMGLCSARGKLYAGSWNGVYEIDPVSLQANRFITNKLMCDIHGLTADENYIYSCLTCRDTLVISDFDGNVVETYTIGSDLSVVEDNVLSSHDWRFVSKQVRGSVGLFHFNFVQRIGDEIYITCRNLTCFIVLDLKTKKCRLRPFNAKTPLLIHDGVLKGEYFYFTSIDGKVIIAEEGSETGGIYQRDLIVFNEITLARNPNWCRGIDVNDDGVIMATVDGRYGAGTSFGVQGINSAGDYLGEIRLEYAKAGFKHPIQYMTGFDILAESVPSI